MTETRAKEARSAQQLNALTSLRFVAAMYVLLFHYVSALPSSVLDTQLIRIGYSGVTFFFLLSGFILAHNYHSFDFKEPNNLYRFFVARFSRIYPIYILSLAVSAPFAVWASSGAPTGIMRTLAAGSGLLAPLGLQAWLPGASCVINCPAWSISVELFFYILFPVLVWPVLFRPQRWLIFSLGLWVAICSAYLWMWHVVAPDDSIITPHERASAALAADAIKYFPFGRLPEFVLGIVLYGIWRRPHGRFGPGKAAAAFAAGAVLIVALTERIPEILLHNGLTAVVWAPLILASAGLQRGPLCSSSAVFLGRSSFALYLFHVPVLQMMMAFDSRILGTQVAQNFSLAFPVYALTTIIIAALIFVFIEEPLRRLVPRWLSPARTRLS